MEHEDLAGSTTYTAAVQASDLLEAPMEVPFSWSFTTKAVNEPAVAVEPVIDAVGEQVSLSWQAYSENCQYQVYRSTTPYTGYAPWQTPFSETSFLDNPGTIGTVGTNYFYFIESLSCSGGSPAESKRVGEFDYALVTVP